MSAKFITDMGCSRSFYEVRGAEPTYVPRYAVWGDSGRDKPEVLETSDDVDDLQARFGPLPVWPVGPLAATDTIHPWKKEE